MAVTACECRICGYATAAAEPGSLGTARGNTERFRTRTFRLWQCPECHSIWNIDPIDFEDLYRDYPLNRRQLDVFARGTQANLLRRLTAAGMTPSGSVLDVGCGESAVFIEFLRERRFLDVTGYDPYSNRYRQHPGPRQFDAVVANDVIEHVPDPRAFARECAAFVKPGGLLYIGTADSRGVDMAHLERELMRLHQPFHRVLFDAQQLQALGRDTGLDLVTSYRRSYMDTLRPFSNYRFLDEFNGALGHVLDRSLDPDAGTVVLKRPALLFFALFGYFLPCADEPAIVLRKPR